MAKGPRASKRVQAADATFKKGDLIGGEYLIYKLIGKGGFGEVYLGIPAFRRKRRLMLSGALDS